MSGSTNPTSERQALYGVRNYEHQGEKKSHWTQIGTAFACKDGSWNLVFDYVPSGRTEMTINLRPFHENDRGDA